MKLFAHSKKDVFLVALPLIEAPLHVYGTATFGQLSVLMTVSLGALLVFFICTNFQCTAHNFLHNPFFVSTRLNQIFSVFNTLVLGMPQSLYRLHHLHHHKYNNDEQDPKTGLTQDRTSTYRYARRLGQEEPILSYALLGVLRTSFKHLMPAKQQQRSLSLSAVEMAALAMFVALLCMLNWRGFLFFYLPVWYFGHSAALAENYLEHHGALPGNRLTDSVSCYNALYNFIWFNNGYHQEHHYRPQIHWTKLPEIRCLMRPGTERRVVRGAHWFNFNPPARHVYAKRNVSAGREYAP
jgi:fatty acid desaturase